MKTRKFSLMINGRVYATTNADTVKKAWHNLRVENNGITGVVSPHLHQSLVYLARGNLIESVTGNLLES